VVYSTNLECVGAMNKAGDLVRRAHENGESHF
jgi:hypothetical protein